MEQWIWARTWAWTAGRLPTLHFGVCEAWGGQRAAETLHGHAEAACCLVEDAEGLGRGEAGPRSGGGGCRLCEGRHWWRWRKPR